MAQPRARLGDSSDHGGHIITASSDVLVNGIPAVREGDLHACPISGHGVTPISSSSTVKVDGRSTVRVGDTAGCGAQIAQGSSNVTAG